MCEVKVKLGYPAIMHVDHVRSGDFIELPSGATIEELMTCCNVKKEHQKYVLTVVNGERRNLSHILQDLDEVKLFLPVGGG